MEMKDFITITVSSLDTENMNKLRDMLIGEYITFSFLEEDQISQEVFAEKLFDYFEKLELKTKDKFEDTLHAYLTNWDTLVGKKIAKEPQAKKGEAPLPVPRARKYYSKMDEMKKSRNLTKRQIIDYSRIAMCLYTAIIRNPNSEITDFDYSVSCLDIDKMIAAMKDEKTNGIKGIGKKNLFDLSELYCQDTSTFIITIIMFYYIKYMEIVGEY